MLTNFAWNDIQLFLALYRERTMGRAAAALRIDTSTISRRLNTLEEALGTELFERSRGPSTTEQPRTYLARRSGSKGNHRFLASPTARIAR